MGYLQNLYEAIMGRRPTFGMAQGMEIMNRINAKGLSQDGQEAVKVAIAGTVGICSANYTLPDECMAAVQAAESAIDGENVALRVYDQEADDDIATDEDRIKRLEAQIAEIKAGKVLRRQQSVQVVNNLKAEKTRATEVYDFFNA